MPNRHNVPGLLPPDAAPGASGGRMIGSSGVPALSNTDTKGPPSPGQQRTRSAGVLVAAAAQPERHHSKADPIQKG